MLRVKIRLEKVDELYARGLPRELVELGLEPCLYPLVQVARVVGYLLAKDLIAASAGQDWNTLLRPVLAIGPDNDVEATLGLMQSEGAMLCVVEDRGIPLGLITFEDIVEQVFGRMEDEYPHEAEGSLANAVAVGGAILDLAGSTRDEVIRELAATLPADKLPPQANIAELALAREAEVSTDLGVGVAVPHARCPNLRTPLVVFGRSSEGIMFSPQARELVQLLLLLVTPAEQGDVQLSLLAQVATVAGDASARERLRRASSAPEVIEIIAAKHHPRAMP